MVMVFNRNSLYWYFVDVKVAITLIIDKINENTKIIRDHEVLVVSNMIGYKSISITGSTIDCARIIPANNKLTPIDVRMIVT